MINQQPVHGYELYASVDLRPFDNTAPDFGVESYIECLGFIPTGLFLHETYIDQLHLLADVPIDDSPLLSHWVSQRAMPGAQVWSRRQFKGLIDALHQRGIRFYQGTEAAWSYWPEYGGKATWIYEHLSELFVTYRDGSTSADDMGAINVLKRLKDGRLYEDVLCNLLPEYLAAYDMDGYFAADGMIGLTRTLEFADYSDDMIEQFEAQSGVRVTDGSTLARAEHIWAHHRSAWIAFWAERWTQFYDKLAGTLRRANKDLVAFTPWGRGAGDALAEYGIDYRRLSEVGLPAISLEIMEEVLGRFFRSPYQDYHSWESTGVANLVTIKAHAPNLKVIWTASTCNNPEHWQSFQDTPNIIERECFSLPNVIVIDQDGHERRTISGVLTIFGIDMLPTEWPWFRDRLDFAFHLPVEHMVGPALVWSDAVLYEHARRGERWHIDAATARLIFAGLPIHSGISTANLGMARADSYLVIDPIGITDREVEALLAKVHAGADLIVVGEVNHPALLQELGIAKAVPIDSEAWKQATHEEVLAGFRDVAGQIALGLGDYVVISATSLVNLIDEHGDPARTLLSVRQSSGGRCLFIRRAAHTLMTLVGRSETVREAYPSFPGSDQQQSLTPIRSDLMAVASIHPDAYDILTLAAYRWLSHEVLSVDRGQIWAAWLDDGSLFAAPSNAANLFYSQTALTSQRTLVGVDDYQIKHPGQVGYLMFNGLHPHHVDVCVPPEGSVPLRLQVD